MWIRAPFRVWLAILFGLLGLGLLSVGVGVVLLGQPHVADYLRIVGGVVCFGIAYGLYRWYLATGT